MSTVTTTTTRKVPADLRTKLGKADNWITETRMIIRGTITSVTRGPRKTAENPFPEGDTITLDGVDTFDVGRDGLSTIATDPFHLPVTDGAETALVGLVADVALVERGSGDREVTSVRVARPGF